MGKVELVIAVFVAVVCVVNAQSYVKPGLCPEYEFNSTYKNNVTFDCLSDSECYYEFKCCLGPDLVQRCTRPVSNTTTAMPLTTTKRFEKPGHCPLPKFSGGCSGEHQCTHDWECSGDMKCCRPYILDGCPSVCRYPDSNSSLPVSPSPKPSSQPHQERPGVCPNNYQEFNKFWFYDDYTSCFNHCNSSADCGEGELCCMDNEAPIPYFRKRRHVHGCPVCMKAKVDCDVYGRTYKHGEIYTESYDRCTLCQCFNGETMCFSVCSNYNDYDDDGWWNPPLYLPQAWIAPSIAAASALILSMLFTLSVCCSMKCCCKDKKRTIVVHQQPPTMVQQPGNGYFVVPPKEDRIPLTESGYTTA